jgi:hypothetical protein
LGVVGQGGRVPEVLSYERLMELVDQLRGRVEALSARNAELEPLLAEKVEEIA